MARGHIRYKTPIRHPGTRLDCSTSRAYGKNPTCPGFFLTNVLHMYIVYCLQQQFWISSECHRHLLLTCYLDYDTPYFLDKGTIPYRKDFVLANTIC